MKTHLPIVVSVDGGLGDHISAEPTIRYLTKVYPQQVSVASLYPRVFEHLGLPLVEHNAFRLGDENITYRKLISFPRDGALTQAVSFLVCHAVDYHAMAMLHRTLPLLDKTYRLGVSNDDRISLLQKLRGRDPKKCILVHAGKSWKSKTFPRAWWQATVDVLADAGFEVCLIGKRASSIENDATGLVEITLPRGGLDLRDTLSLGELFALIEAAPVLLSNDSSPIQIAGAFDNWIFLIATCKHPDFVLPYRHGTPHYKSKALFKRLAIDDQPFEPIRNSLLNVNFDVPDWSLYLPEPQDIAVAITAALHTDSTTPANS